MLGRQAIKLFLWMTCLTGIIYPLLITAIAQFFIPFQASGGLIQKQSKVIGAQLISQKFESANYFWPRPSANDYNGLASGGSNLAPTSLALKEIVAERRKKIAEAHQADPKEIPSELLFSSGSGLDPHISAETAYFQINRVAAARQLNRDDLQALVDDLIEESFLTPPCINVLLLNDALELVNNDR